MVERRIESRRNELITRVRSLRDSRQARWRERAFLVEGPRFVADLLAAGQEPEVVLAADSVQLSGALRGVPIVRVSERVFSSFSDTEHSQGVTAVFPFPELPPSTREAPLLVALDGVQDPGNVGTLLRSAAAAGVDAVWAVSGTADPYNPKVVRAAAAAHAHLPIRVGVARDLPTDGMQLVLAEAASTAVAYDEVNWRGPTLLVLGSEAHGPSDDFRRLPHVTVAIPMHRPVDSLNVGMAGSILMFEAARQRRLSG
jgi:TrmH family RNA methyltransferase